MRKYSIHQVDSFTDQLFGGNPTIIVLDADTLKDQEMRLIAREMNLSETGFILKSQIADFRLRFFTPSGSEIKFCGHATVGALYTLAKEGMFNIKSPGKKLKVETNAGILSIEVLYQTDGRYEIILDSLKIELNISRYNHGELAKGLGIPRTLIDSAYPVMFEKTNQYLYFAVESLEQLRQFQPDMGKAVEFAREDNIVVFCALTPHGFNPNNQVHSRGFAPLVGVAEDPFTGSMQAGLAAYLFKNQMLSKNAKMIISEQGHFIHRPGEVLIEISSQEPFKARLHAKAVHVFSSAISLI